MRARWFHILLWLLPFLKAEAQDTLHLIFAGDIMMHGPQIRSAYQPDGSYDFASSFRYLQEIFDEADAVTGNLETTLVKQHYTGYPRFGAPDTLAYQLRQAGFTHLVTANNHSCDRGRNGLINTVHRLDSAGIRHTGTGIWPRTGSAGMIIRKGNIRMAVLNYTYGTNGLPVPTGCYVNRIDTSSIKNDIRRLRRTGQYDDIMIFLHWGIQYRYAPDAYQKQIEKFLHRQGIRYIIGSHPHIVQPVVRDTAGDRLTVYSLGNFISNQRDFPRDGSMLIHLYLVKEQGKLHLAKVTYTALWTYKGMKEGKTLYEVIPITDFLLRKTYFQPASAYAAMIRYLHHLQGIMRSCGIPEEHPFGIWHEIPPIPEPWMPPLPDPGLETN